MDPKEFFQTVHSMWLQPSGADSHIIWDVIITTEDNHEIRASKMFLCAHSKYFLGLYSNNNFKEASANTLHLCGVPGNILREIVASIFSQKPVILTIENVTQYLEASDFLQMEWLTKQCLEFMSQNLNASTVVDFCAVASKHSCEHFLKEHSRPIAIALLRMKSASSDAIRVLGVERLLDLIKSAPDDERQEVAIFTWYERLRQLGCDVEISASQLLDCVDIQGSSAEGLRALVNNQLVKSSPECLLKVCEALISRVSEQDSRKPKKLRSIEAEVKAMVQDKSTALSHRLTDLQKRLVAKGMHATRKTLSEALLFMHIKTDEGRADVPIFYDRETQTFLDCSDGLF